MTATVFCPTCARTVHLAGDDAPECPVCLLPLVAPSEEALEEA